MLLFVQFLVRLSCGMAFAMSGISPQKVTSGYYRNNCYVLLGLNLLAALGAWRGEFRLAKEVSITAVAAAVMSYVGAATWLYEKPRAGIFFLRVGAMLSAFGVIATGVPARLSPNEAFWVGDAILSAGLIGLSTTAMLLGHWYLNAPGMQIRPLQDLVVALGAAVIFRAFFSGFGLAWNLDLGLHFEYIRWLMLALRWLTTVVGTAILVFMTRATLKIPNTQAATGLLYVAVLTTFLGELLGQLLSAGTPYPL